MSVFQRILVAVDPSPARHSAVRLAGELAQLTDAEVRVFERTSEMLRYLKELRHIPRDRAAG